MNGPIILKKRSAAMGKSTRIRRGLLNTRGCSASYREIPGATVADREDESFRESFFEGPKALGYQKNLRI
ncbi:MAG: hypothetical protein NTV25_06705 [Methanothrix sp.]|nr:hypothetical protein [Methanothrix sp.]